MDNTRFLEEMFDDTPCRLEDIPYKRPGRRVGTTSGPPAFQGDRNDGGNAEDLPDLPSFHATSLATSAMLSPVVASASKHRSVYETPSKNNFTDPSVKATIASSVKGSVASPRVMFGSTPVNVALHQERPSLPPGHVASELDKSAVLLAVGGKSVVSEDDPRSSAHDITAPPSNKEKRETAEALRSLQENMALQQTVHELSSRTGQLEATIAQQARKITNMTTLLEESTAYIASLKDAIAQEQDTRKAVEERCATMEAAFKDSHAEMEGIQSELKRRLGEISLRCEEAEQAVRQGKRDMLELQRVRAAYAAEVDAHTKSKEALEAERNARTQAEIEKQESDRRLAEALEHSENHQRECQSTIRTYEEAQRQDRTSLEQLKHQLYQVQEENRRDRQARALADLCLDGLLAWLNSEACDRDSALTSSMTVERLCTHLGDTAPGSAGDHEEADPLAASHTSPHPATDRETHLCDATLFRLSQQREAVLAAVSQWQQGEARKEAILYGAIQHQVTQVVAACAREFQRVERSVSGLDSRLLRVEGSTRAWLATAREERTAAIQTSERLEETEADKARMEVELSKMRATLDDAQRLHRLQKAELRSVQKQCAALGEQLHLQDVFAFTADAVQELRRLTAREIRNAVEDLRRATSRVGSGAASLFDQEDAFAPTAERSTPRTGLERALEDVVLRTEAHISLIHKTLRRCNDERYDSTFHSSRAGVSSHVPSTSHHSGDEGLPPAWSGPQPLAEMTSRQQTIYSEMQRLLQRPPVSATTSAAGAAHEFLEHQHHRRDARDHAVGNTSSALLAFPSEEALRVLDAKEALCDTAERLAQQLQNLSAVVTHHTKEAACRTRDVTDALRSWERSIAEGLEQCASAMESRLGVELAKTLVAPQAVPIPAAPRQEELCWQVPPCASRCVRPRSVTEVAPVRSTVAQAVPPDQGARLSSTPKTDVNALTPQETTFGRSPSPLLDHAARLHHSHWTVGGRHPLPLDISRSTTSVAPLNGATSPDHFTPSPRDEERRDDPWTESAHTALDVASLASRTYRGEGGAPSPHSATDLSSHYFAHRQHPHSRECTSAMGCVITAEKSADRRDAHPVPEPGVLFTHAASQGRISVLGTAHHVPSPVAADPVGGTEEESTSSALPHRRRSTDTQIPSPTVSLSEALSGRHAAS